MTEALFIALLRALLGLCIGLILLYHFGRAFFDIDTEDEALWLVFIGLFLGIFISGFSMVALLLAT